jgi:O-acetylserine/cysteine efflux transporter
LRPIDIALAVAVNLAWGLNFVITKLGVAEMPPMMLVAFRYALVALVLAPWLRWPTGKFLQVAAVSVTLGFLHFALMFTGVSGVDASVAAIAVQVQVPFSALLAYFLFKDKLGWRRGAGVAMAISGVLLIAGGPNAENGGADPFYVGLIVMAAFAWAVSSVQVKKIGTIGTLTLNAWIALLAWPQLALGSLLIEGGSWDDIAGAGVWAWSSIVYMAIAVTVFGYGIWYRLIQRYDVTQVIPLSLLAPTFGVIFGILLLDEAATFEKLFGGSMTLVGVAIVTLIKPPPKAAPKPVPNSADTT